MLFGDDGGDIDASNINDTMSLRREVNETIREVHNLRYRNHNKNSSESTENLDDSFNELSLN